jgi:hypothetical protein
LLDHLIEDFQRVEHRDGPLRHPEVRCVSAKVSQKDGQQTDPALAHSAQSAGTIVGRRARILSLALLWQPIMESLLRD